MTLVTVAKISECCEGGLLQAKNRQLHFEKPSFLLLKRQVIMGFSRMHQRAQKPMPFPKLESLWNGYILYFKMVLDGSLIVVAFEES